MNFNGNELTQNYQKLHFEMLELSRIVSQHLQVPVVFLTINDFAKYFKTVKNIRIWEGDIPGTLVELRGLIMKHVNRVVITTNESLNTVEKSQVIGHELGHYVAHLDCPNSHHSFAGVLAENGYHESQYVSEFEANQLALMFLVNDWALLNALANKCPFVSITQQFLKRK